MYAVYVCMNKRCRRFKREFTGMTPSDYRLAIGRAVKCPACGTVVALRRIEPDNSGPACRTSIRFSE